MIASAAAPPPIGAELGTRSEMPATTLSMGSRWPIRPVEQTATSDRADVRAGSGPRSSAVRWVSAKPSGPVQAFAPPEFRMTARSRPSASTCWDHSTGAALTRLVVKTPAAAKSGPVFSTRARSGRPLDFRPAARPAGRKPGCRGDAHGATPTSGQTGGLRQSERQVHALHRAAGGALGQVVQGGDGDQPAGGRVDGDLDLDRVRAEHRLGLRPLACGQQLDERLVGVGPGVGRVRLLRRSDQGRAAGAVQVARMPRDIGTSTGVKDTVGGSAPQASEVLQQLRGVPVHAADPVRAGRPDQLRPEQVRLERPAGARGPAGRHDDHVVGVGQARGDGGHQRQGCRRRIAAGNGDRSGRRPACPADPAAPAGRTARCRHVPCRRTRCQAAGSSSRKSAPQSITTARVAARRRERPRPRAAGPGTPHRARPAHPVWSRPRCGRRTAPGAAAAPPAAARTGARRDRADLDMRMAVQQAKQLPARVAGGPGHGNPEHHMHDYVITHMFMQTRWQQPARSGGEWVFPLVHPGRGRRRPSQLTGHVRDRQDTTHQTAETDGGPKNQEHQHMVGKHQQTPGRHIRAGQDKASSSRLRSAAMMHGRTRRITSSPVPEKHYTARAGSALRAQMSAYLAFREPRDSYSDRITDEFCDSGHSHAEFRLFRDGARRLSAWVARCRSSRPANTRSLFRGTRKLATGCCSTRAATTTM